MSEEPPDPIFSVGRFENLRAAVEMVTYSPAELIDWMNRTRFGSDELLNQLDYVRGTYAPNLMGTHKLLVSGLRAVDALIEEMDSWTDYELWSSDAALTGPEWEHARATARSTLRVLDADWELHPNSD